MKPLAKKESYLCSQLDYIKIDGDPAIYTVFLTFMPPTHVW